MGQLSTPGPEFGQGTPFGRSPKLTRNAVRRSRVSAAQFNPGGFGPTEVFLGPTAWQLAFEPT